MAPAAHADWLDLRDLDLSEKFENRDCRSVDHIGSMSRTAALPMHPKYGHPRPAFRVLRPRGVGRSPQRDTHLSEASFGERERPESIVVSDALHAVASNVQHSREPDKPLVSPPAGGASLAPLLSVLLTPEIVRF